MALERQARTPERGAAVWIRKHIAGLAAAVVGLVAVAVSALVFFDGSDVTEIPDPVVTAPFLVVCLAAAIASLVRKEGSYALAAAGVGLAASAMVIGWAIVVGAIVLATVIIIIVLHQLM